jgi:hypothetical protein
MDVSNSALKPLVVPALDDKDVHNRRIVVPADARSTLFINNDEGYEK